MGGGIFCSMTVDANSAFSAARIDDLDASIAAPGADIMGAIASLGLGSPAERDFLATFPAAELEKLRAAVSFALTSVPRVPMVFFFSFVESGRQVHVSNAVSDRALHVVLTGPEHGPGARSA